MRRPDLEPVAALAVAAVFAILGVASCAQSDALVARDTPPPPSFTPGTDGGEPDGSGLPAAPLMCVGTECPAGFGTCLSGPVGSAPHKCGTDLMRDADNCGACGNKCGEFEPLHMTSRCVEGACVAQCTSPGGVGAGDWRNCNGKIADGCEVDVLSDKDNCGTCGNVCPDGVGCIQGKCGCPAGQTECDGYCTNTNVDDNHCGTCGHACGVFPGPDECAVPPPNTVYACEDGQCGHLRCQNGWTDCNNDIPTLGCDSDGCEAPFGVDNCGQCGNKCKEHESCLVDNGNAYCGIPCVKDKKVLCGPECVDLLNDVDACGACGIGCPSPGPHGKRTCTNGVCGSECLEGWADCNNDPADGCEVDLRTTPDHCGACGTQCDVARGQPCVEGKCLMVDCDYPGAK